MKCIFNISLVVLSLIAYSTAVIANEHVLLYNNEKYGFSFVYPKFDDGNISERNSELESDPLIFQVIVDDGFVSFLSVSVFEKSKEIDLLSFVIDYYLSFGLIQSQNEVGIIETTVDGKVAFQLTYWLSPGTGCATSELITANGNWIYRISTICNSTYLPTIHKSFKFLNK